MSHPSPLALCGRAIMLTHGLWCLTLLQGRKRARVDDGMDVSEPDPPTWLQLMEKKRSVCVCCDAVACDTRRARSHFCGAGRGGEVAAPFKTLVSQGLQHAPAPRLKGVIDMDNFMLHQHPGQMHSVTQTAFKVQLSSSHLVNDEYAALDVIMISMTMRPMYST